MPVETARLGVVAGDLVYAWQRDVLDRLRAGGTAIVARFAARRDQRPTPLPPAAARLAAGASGAFTLVPWDAPPILSPERAADLDAVLIFAQPEVSVFLGRARWGMWDVVLPGDPPAFELVERGAGVAEVRVERVGADERTVVASAATLVDATSYRRTLQRVIDIAVSLPADAVRRCSAAVPEERAAPSTHAAAPIGARRALTLSARCALRRARHAVVRRLVHDRWRLGILQNAPAAIVSGAAAQIAWMDLPSDRFWADPFPLASGGRIEVLCEGYDYARDRGYLARVPLEDGRVCAPPRDLARRDHHLSYPYVVEDGDARYVMPEESQARRVALYEITSDGMREARVLVDGVAAVDPTLLRYDDRWWLFLTDDAVDNNGELLLFHAATLDGPWDAHPLNPIVRDVRSARPAGTPFVVDGVLYRPAQDCSDGYGARVAIARVDVLTTGAYRETVVAHVEPPAHGRGRHGLHTVALRDGVCVVDGKDRVFDAAATLAILRSDVRRLFRTSRHPSHTSPAPQVFQPS